LVLIIIQNAIPILAHAQVFVFPFTRNAMWPPTAIDVLPDQQSNDVSHSYRMEHSYLL